jgi:hypothetical protein
MELVFMLSAVALASYWLGYALGRAARDRTHDRVRDHLRNRLEVRDRQLELARGELDIASAAPEPEPAQPCFAQGCHAPASRPWRYCQRHLGGYVVGRGKGYQL